ncbi:4Fe-4S dicluster domain-containing protein [Treponema sp. C6A8]|uniref:4Fe-4S dicluster domain-containing protein n=1 Tax=Treponema sp. C6A8 TaxID=1410609 RepID=UPI00048614C3|nr:4Fe-4S dicluster domain-containing protein [Treponema sp. C6A8]
MILFAEKADELKNYTCSQNAFLPHHVTIPLSQEYNTSCNPLVRTGELVTEGQIIAASDKPGKISVHASIPGVVEEIVECQCPNGKTEKAVKIRLQGSFDFLGRQIPSRPIDTLSAQEIQEHIFDSGIINTFNVKKPVNLGNQINNFSGQTLVIRLFDDDPSCITDRLLTKFYFERMMKACGYLLKALGRNNIVFIYNSKLTPKTLFDPWMTETTDFLDVNSNEYPAGLEAKIIDAFNKNVKAGKASKRNKTNKNTDIVLTKKDLFIDASTLYEVYKCVAKKIPSINRLVHVSGNCLKSSCFLNIKIGTTIRDIISQIGGMIKTPKMIIINGRLRGSNAASLDMPITRYVKSISIVSGKNTCDSKIYDCINCGNCRAVCKQNVFPDVIYNHVTNFNIYSLENNGKNQDVEELLKTLVAKCVDCGTCNMACPSRLPLTQIINMLRDDYNV